MKTKVAAVGIDCHGLLTYVLKYTELVDETSWPDESTHARKELVSFLVHAYPHSLTSFALLSVWINDLYWLHGPLYVANRSMVFEKVEATKCLRDYCHCFDSLWSLVSQKILHHVKQLRTVWRASRNNIPKESPEHRCVFRSERRREEECKEVRVGRFYKAVYFKNICKIPCQNNPGKSRRRERNLC